MATSDQQPYPVPLAVGATAMGIPILFSQGPFAGKTIRTTLTELQKSNGGRKFARKDRRPIDPPPIVQVRFFEVLNQGMPTQHEIEIVDYDDIMLGLICHACLYPIPEELTPESMASQDANNSIAGVDKNPISNNTIPYGSFLLEQRPGFTMSDPTDPSTLTMALNPPIHPQAGPFARASRDVIAYYKNYAITESSNRTRILSGARVTTAVALQHNSRPTLSFVFNDLAVQQEGSYVLHYRIFNIFASTTLENSVAPVLANCFGGAFKIWSTKSFPGLSPVTTLTKRISYYSPVFPRRFHERKPKKAKINQPGPSETPQTAASAASQVDISASSGSRNYFQDTFAGRIFPGQPLGQ